MKTPTAARIAGASAALPEPAGAQPRQLLTAQRGKAAFWPAAAEHTAIAAATAEYTRAGSRLWHCRHLPPLPPAAAAKHPRLR